MLRCSFPCTQRRAAEATCMKLQVIVRCYPQRGNSHCLHQLHLTSAAAMDTAGILLPFRCEALQGQEPIPS